MPSEKAVKAESRHPHTADTDGRTDISESLIHSLLGLLENCRGLVHCRTSSPLVSFRYGGNQAVKMRPPAASAFPPPDITADFPRETALPAADDPDALHHTLADRTTQPEPAEEVCPPPVQPWNENSHTPAAEKSGEPPRLQQGKQTGDNHETVTTALPLSRADDPVGSQDAPPAGAFRHESPKEAPFSPIKLQSAPLRIPDPPTSGQPINKVVSQPHQSWQQTASNAAAIEAVEPQASSRLSHRAAVPEKVDGQGENSRKEQRAAPVPANPQPAAQPKAPTERSRQEITVPGVSPGQRLFPHITSLMNEAIVAREKSSPVQQRPAAEGDELRGTVRQDAAFSGQVDQAHAADQEETDGVTPVSLYRTARQQQKRPFPAVTIENAPTVRTEPRQAESPKRGAAQPACDDGEAYARLEQLGKSFQQLLAKKLTGPGQKEEPPRPEAARNKPKQPVKQVVIIQRQQTGQKPATTPAFWERSYLGRSRLTIIR